LGVGSGARLASGGDAVTLENRCYCEDGSYVWLVWLMTRPGPSGPIYAAARGLTARASASGDDIDVVIAHDIAAIPARRFGTAEEFGRICAFLCSAHAGYITGQNILVDGGFFPAAF